MTAPAFSVHLDGVFEGPFDLLLGLISKHKLDVTEVALSQVTDEFIAHTARPATTGTSARRRSSSSSPRPCSTSRRPGCCPARRSRTRRTSRCSRRATCCSPGCCSTGRTSRRRRTSPGCCSARRLRYPRSVALEPRFAGAAARGAARPRAAGVRRAGRPGAGAPGRPGRRGRPRPRRRRSASGRRRRCCTSGSARAGGGSFRALTADCDGHAGGGRALPRAARALPRGPGRPSTRPRRSGSCTCAGPGPDGPATTGRDAAGPSGRAGDGMTERTRTRPDQAAAEAPRAAAGAARGGAAGHRRAGCRRSVARAGRRARRRPRSRRRWTSWRGSTPSGPRLRAARGRRRLAALHPGRVRALRRAVRPGRPAGPAHPGGAGDAGGDRLPPAGHPGARERGARRQRRRRGAHAAGPRAGRRGRHRPRQRARTLYRTTPSVLERLGLASLEELPSLAPLLPDLGELDTDSPSPEGRPVTAPRSLALTPDDEGIRLQKVLAAAGHRPPAGLRGADRRGPGVRRRRDGHGAGHAGGPRDRGHPGRRHAHDDVEPARSTSR